MPVMYTARIPASSARGMVGTGANTNVGHVQQIVCLRDALQEVPGGKVPVFLMD